MKPRARRDENGVIFRRKVDHTGDRCEPGHCWHIGHPIGLHRRMRDALAKAG